MIEGAQTIQAEGYLAVAPDMAAQLRGGDDAHVLAPPPHGLTLSSIDFDRKGAAVVGGRASPGAMVDLTLDGRPVGEATAGPQGAFTVDLGEPLTPGLHRLAVASLGHAVEVTADTTFTPPPPGALVTGGATNSGWRVTWTPPGGGVQTTLIFAQAFAR